MRKYNKGDALKVKESGEIGFYLDEFDSDSGTIVLMGGLSSGVAYLPESKIEGMLVSFEQRMLMVLCDVSLTMKTVLENIEEALQPTCPDCGEPMHQVDDDDDDDSADDNKEKLN